MQMHWETKKGTVAAHLKENKKKRKGKEKLRSLQSLENLVMILLVNHSLCFHYEHKTATEENGNVKIHRETIHGAKQTTVGPDLGFCFSLYSC